MVISSPAKVIVLHLPRTGGNSVREILEKTCVVEDVRRRAAFTDDEMEAFDTENPVHRGLHKHSKLRDYQRVLGADFSSYRRVVFRRNVYERLISLYFAPVSVYARSQRGAPSGWDRGEFSSLLSHCHPLDHVLWLPGCESPWSCVDYVGHQERLEESLREACAACGLPPPAPLRIRNQGSHGRASSYLDSDLKEIIDGKFAAELSHFGDVLT